MEELKPCPFCGGNNLEVDAAGTYDGKEYSEWINCLDCEANGSISRKASQAWNTRPAPDSIKDIEHVGECPCKIGEVQTFEDGGYVARVCDNCNGTGEITRQATLEEVVEVFKKSLIWGGVARINGGTLKLKERG